MNDEIDADWAASVQQRAFGWPYVRERLTQPRLERVWELRHNFTPYDAIYLATTEALQAEHLDETALLTADLKLRNAPKETLPCQILTFPPMS